MIWVPYCYKAIAERVIDGDTVIFSIDLGCFVYIVRHCRLLGINAPEMHDPDPDVRAEAIRAQQILTEQLGTGPVLIRTELDHDDKYGRLLVTIYETEADQKSLNRQMVEWGLAREYIGFERV